MTTILATFTVSLLFALLLTPSVCWIARRFGIVDQPSDRKVHLKPIPRLGGVAMFLAFLLALIAAVAMLIPVIALGIPLMDTILAPIRRFMTGRALFQPDKSHIHHKLLQMGLTTRKAVLIMYGASIVLGFFALVAVNARDEKVGLAMFILAVSVILGFRKLGYLEYFAVDKMIGYFNDVTDVMGFKKDRRTFLSRQIAINDAHNPDDMWFRIVDALELLKFDKAEMCFNGKCSAFHENGNYRWCGRQICQDGEEAEFRVLRLDLPLVNDKETYGTLHLYKDLMHDPISHYTIYSMAL
ncbi:MAG: hypothetical protein WCA08_03160 [Desulfoferrobacter sp.]